MRTKFKGCSHPTNLRLWRRKDPYDLMICSECRTVLRSIPICPKCKSQLQTTKRQEYGGTCIYVECPSNCYPPILWNKILYYGAENKVVHPTEHEKKQRVPIFAWIDKEEKPSHRWHYGREEWVSIKRRD